MFKFFAITLRAFAKIIARNLKIKYLTQIFAKKRYTANGLIFYFNILVYSEKSESSLRGTKQSNSIEVQLHKIFRSS